MITNASRMEHSEVLVLVDDGVLSNNLNCNFNVIVRFPSGESDDSVASCSERWAVEKLVAGGFGKMEGGVRLDLAKETIRRCTHSLFLI